MAGGDVRHSRQGFSAVEMADVFSREKRSAVMSAIRSSGNKTTELRLVRSMRLAGITGWRRGSRLEGRPDFVFPSEKLAVFVDGCFWHGCSRCYSRPKTNQAFWDDKIRNNRARDSRVDRKLKHLGWRVLRLWEHELRNKRAGFALNRIRRRLAR